MSGVITTGTFPKLLFPGIRALFGDTYNEYPPEYSYIFESLTSDKNYEEDILVSGTGMAIAKTQGEGISYSTMRQGYIQRYLNITYALGYIITMEEIQDNLYPKFADFRTKQLAISGRQTKETIGANILNRAFSSSYLYGDGVALCANNHPITGRPSPTFLHPTLTFLRQLLKMLWSPFKTSETMLVFVNASLE